jgi:hypothetical protein
VSLIKIGMDVEQNVIGVPISHAAGNKKAGVG